MKEGSSIDALISGTKTEQGIAKALARGAFERQAKIKGEREKTPAEMVIIGIADKMTTDLRARYGLKDFSVPAKNIHIKKETDWDKESGGVTFSGEQAVWMKECDSSTQFAHVVLHEMLHMKSVQVWELKPGIADKSLFHFRLKPTDKDEAVVEASVSEYRSGLMMKSRPEGKSYFEAFNEAVIESLTMDMVKELRRQPPFLAEWNRTKRLIEEKSHTDARYKDAEFVELHEGSNGIEGQVFVYKKERQALEALMQKIRDVNPGVFKTREDVFELFTKCLFTGKMLQLGKIIDHTFGKGTFRKIAEFGSDAESLGTYIEGLSTEHDVP